MNASLAAVHAPPPPAALSIAFILLVTALYIGVLAWLRGAGVSPTRITVTRLAVLGWLMVTALAAMAGLLSDFYSLPPRFLFVVVPAILAVVAIALHPHTGPLLDQASGAWLVGFQFFRVPMELILWQLAVARVIPAMMTFEGRNFDVLVGLTAPVIAWLAFTKKWLSPGPVIFWNLFGLALLANIVAIAALSTPTRFRQFFEGPPNEMIGGFPFVWLIAFVVPLALLGHLASIPPAGARPEGRPSPPGPGRADVKRTGRGWWVLAIFIALLVVSPEYLRFYKVQGDSDAPAFVTGDLALVHRAAFDLRVPFTGMVLSKLGNPKPGDMVLLRIPDGTLTLKRVVAGPGTRVAMNDDHLVVDGKELDYRLIADNERLVVKRGRVGSVMELERGNGPDIVVSYTPGGESVGLHDQEVPAGTYFVLGSNRDLSVDSRSFGPIPRDRILGKVIAKLW